MLLSGSFVIAGTTIAKVEHIGEENYTAKISKDARYIKKVNSEMMKSLNEVIRTISVAIIPIGLLLFRNQYSLAGATFQSAVVNTVAAVIGMIPEGLILLTSTVLAVSVVRLSKQKVLVQQMYCMETLARVDVLCFDKTGTITEGKMEVVKSIPVNNETEKEMKEALIQMVNTSEDTNPTMLALKEKYLGKTTWKVKRKFPFHSKNKWSAISFEQGTYIIGAPEFVLPKEVLDSYAVLLEKWTKQYRVLVCSKTKEELKKNKLPDQVEVLGFLCLQDKIRKEAKETISYFKEQGVNLKVISGDHPKTVSGVAKRAGITNYEKYVDASTIQSEEELEKACREKTIFGRVSPVQKRQIVEILQKQGHTVAMTGDGVNDVLALKKADCSITVATGASAAKSVSEIILLDSNFSSMPKIVAEGRRTINNIQRSASLFLVKTIYASILAVLFVFLTQSYPFMPIQLTLISTITIGIPSFVLALEPNKEKIKGNFLKNVLEKALPTALTIVLNIAIVAFLQSVLPMRKEAYSTLCVFSTALTGFILLFKLCRPATTIRNILFHRTYRTVFARSSFLKRLFPTRGPILE